MLHKRGEVSNPAMVLVLTMVTCGLYGFVWFFKIAKEINEALGEQRFNPGKEIALSVVTCGAWYMWLSWRLSETVVEMQKAQGQKPEMESWMIFASGFFGVFPLVLQMALNKTWEFGGSPAGGGGSPSGGGGGGGPKAPEPAPAAMAGDYLERFQAMVAEMREHPRVSVTHHWVGEPVSEEEIAEVEAALGFALDDRIKTFYRQANGLQFRWMDKLDKTYVEERHGGPTITEYSGGQYICGDNDDALGVIDILPLREALIDAQTEDMIWFDWMAGDSKEWRGKTYDLMEFSKGIRPFDNFSFYNSAAFFLADGEPGATVIMGDDHNATFADSYITDFASYLEFALAHRGTPQPRRDAFIKYGAHKEPRKVFTAADFPTSPLPLEQVLPDRSYLLSDEDLASGAPVRVAVETGMGGGPARGTLVEVVTATSKPNYWSRSTELVRVDFDLGVTGYVVRQGLQVLRKKSVYELAVQNSAEFFQNLLTLPVKERAELLAKIGGGDASSTGYRIEVEGGSMDFLVNFHAGRYLALLNKVDTSTALSLLLQTVEGFIAEGLNNSVTVSDDSESYDEFEGSKRVTYGQIVGTLCGAAGTLLMERYNEAPFASARAAFGDALADQLQRVATSLEGEKLNYSAYPMVDFFAAAADGFPGATELQVRKIGSGYLSEQFGLGVEGLPVLSG